MTISYELSACPACGREGSDMVAARDAVLREMEELWSFHLRRLRPQVPPQRLADRVVFSQDPPLQVVRCRECGLVYRNPRERARSLLEEYGGEEPEPAVLASLFCTQRDAARAQVERLARVTGPVTAGLEVGSYIGGFLAAARERGWTFEGVDVNEQAVRFAREQGLAVSLGTLEEFRSEHPFQVVAIWNCFEQLPEPREALDAARRLLAPGGVLALRVPNGAFYARLRRLLPGPLAPVARSLLAHNNLLGFPYRHGFSPRSLGDLLRARGFEVLRVRGDALVPIADVWTRSWAQREEKLLKAALRGLAAVGLRPWFEVYARVR